MPGSLSFSRRLILLPLIASLGWPGITLGDPPTGLAEIPAEPTPIELDIPESGEATWWLPPGADDYVLPISAGIIVDTADAKLTGWLRNGSPWSLSELPAFGARYGDERVVVIVPWPHYAELIVADRLGVRFSFPEGRRSASPAGILIQRRAADPLEVARGFREWRRTAETTGAIPPPRPFTKKMAELDRAKRLLGAPHFYLWGPALFCRHDVPRNRWLPFANALSNAPSGSFGEKLVRSFSPDQRDALRELADAEWPMNYLTVTVAGAIDAALAESTPEVIRVNRQALATAFADFLNPVETWGDGLSKSLLDALHQAGVQRALLLTSDLYGRSPRPDVTARSDQLGYLIGCYDSYHSVHSPSADPDDTWETAQFDTEAYQHGRILNADGSGHRGFRGRGYHFSPAAARPYLERRVGEIIDAARYSTWFIDCDATAECFDDFSPRHPATRLDDTKLRRERLRWLETEHRLVVGSEGGSALFSDVIHYGHGVHTPFIGHLDPAFRDRESPHYLGRYWPPDTPERSFKSIPVPPSLRSPYFDPTVRIPLYQAALGDEVITTHHWSFDSLKFEDVRRIRTLTEILYRVPPLYHLNRETWPERRDEILRHLAFWAPLHRELAAAPMMAFEWLSDDRLVQRTAFATPAGDVTITVNFDDKPRDGFLPFSATVGGPIAAEDRVYRADERE